MTGTITGAAAGAAVRRVRIAAAWQREAGHVLAAAGAVEAAGEAEAAAGLLTRSLTAPLLGGDPVCTAIWFGQDWAAGRPAAAGTGITTAPARSGPRRVVAAGPAGIGGEIAPAGGSVPLPRGSGSPHDNGHYRVGSDHSPLRIPGALPNLRRQDPGAPHLPGGGRTSTASRA
jgi:hypothetical protein